MGYLKDKVSVDTGSNVGVAEYQIVAGVTNANSNRVFDIEVLHFEVDKTLLGNRFCRKLGEKARGTFLWANLSC